MVTALVIGLILAAALGTIGAGIQYGESRASRSRNKSLKEELRRLYPDLTDTQIQALVDQYGDEAAGFFDFTNLGDQSDNEGLQKLLEDITAAHDYIGDMPELLSGEDLARIEQEAYDQIDSENRQLLALYDQTYQDSASQLQNAMLENSAMFGDYRNQILTNNAMQQQAIAGSVRFELDRQQRNAITRGASAAQRLVTNINTQLGLQAQSAQQSLDTSNALAQNLLAHRQAQQGLRQDYFNARNQYNRDVASTISGQAERRLAHGRAAKGNAIDDNEYAYQAWEQRLNNSGLGSLGEGIYRSRYGNRQNNKPSI